MFVAARTDDDREAGVVSEERIRIDLVRSGGFAGISRRASVDTGTLPPAEAARIAELVKAVDFDALGTLAAGPPGRPDRFQYDLDVHEGGRHHHLTLGERDAPPELRALIDHVLATYG
ncbi:MAG TPA: protealysin inhibitor emfourin [Actinomycetes bacterium]